MASVKSPTLPEGLETHDSKALAVTLKTTTLQSVASPAAAPLAPASSSKTLTNPGKVTTPSLPLRPLSSSYASPSQ